MKDLKYTWEYYGKPEDVAIQHEREERGCYACAGDTWVKDKRKCKHGVKGYPDHSEISCEWWRVK